MSNDLDEVPGPDAFDRDIEYAMAEYDKAGDGVWLFEAIRRCGQYGKKLPERVREPFEDALERYRSGEARTLDEAFGVARPKSWPQSKARTMARKSHDGMSLAGKVYLAVVIRHRDQKKPIGEELFQEVAAEHNISWPTARNYYLEVKAIIKREQEENPGP